MQIIIQDIRRFQFFFGIPRQSVPYDIDLHQFLMDNNISHYVKIDDILAISQHHTSLVAEMGTANAQQEVSYVS